jgi:hypothetical protein
MKIEHVILPNDLVMAADLMWPDSTWSEVLARGLHLALEDAAQAAPAEPPGDPDA